MKSTLYVKSMLGAILLTILYALINLLFNTNTQGSDLNLWNLLASFLTCLILGYYIQNSAFSGLKLSITVFVIYFLIGHFNILIEAWIFNVTDRMQTTREILRGLFVAAVFSPTYVYLFRKAQSHDLPKFAPRSYINWIWRVILGNFLYFLFYMIAGFALYTIYPQLMNFYEGKIPSFELIIKTQLFLRGFIFIAIALLILRTSNLSLAKKAIVTGLVFAIIGGIAPLIPPNELMPAYIRLGHGFEVGISNLLYGLTLGYLLGQKSIKDLRFTSQNTELDIPVQTLAK